MDLDCWMTTLPQPWTVATEATIFTGWIFDHLLPHAAQVKVAHPVMLRAIAASKKKTIALMPARSRTASAVIFSPNAAWFLPKFVIGAVLCAFYIYWDARWCSSRIVFREWPLEAIPREANK
jgi:hypothetical protein